MVIDKINIGLSVLITISSIVLLYNGEYTVATLAMVFNLWFYGDFDKLSSDIRKELEKKEV